jgi:endonuclease YncB( thermonuclease family)
VRLRVVPRPLDAACREPVPRIVLLLVVALALVSGASATSETATYRVDRVIDGDTIALANGERVRLVQMGRVPEDRLRPVPSGRDTSLAAATRRTL